MWNFIYSAAKYPAGIRYIGAVAKNGLHRIVDAFLSTRRVSVSYTHLDVYKRQLVHQGVTVDTVVEGDAGVCKRIRFGFNGVLEFQRVDEILNRIVQPIIAVG